MVLRATAAPPRRMSSRELIGRSSAQHASSCGRWQQLETDAELASGASAKVNRRFGGAVGGEREDGSKLAGREKREVGRRQNLDKICFDQIPDQFSCQPLTARRHRVFGR